MMSQHIDNKGTSGRSISHDAPRIAMPTVGLCLLTWNEIDGCRHDVPLLPKNAFDEVFAIDGGSSDGTVEFLQSEGIDVIQQELPGYNGAYISAFRRCRSDFLVIFHPKGSIDPRETLKFFDYIHDGCDLVVASRIVAGSRNEEDSQWLKPRKWFVMLLAMVASLLWRREGVMIWDVLHGFRGMRAQTFREIALLKQGLSADLEMVARSYRLRVKRAECPVREHPRLSGQTHFKAIPTGWRLMKYVAHELTRRSA